MLLMIGSCAACSTRLPYLSGGTYVVGTAERQLRDMFEATTGQEDGDEVGGCARGYVGPDGSVVLTEVLYPTRMRETARTSIEQLACSGLDGIVARVHFHPWLTDNFGTCSRSIVDMRSHAESTYELDVVVCSNGYRWYRRDGRNEQVEW